MPTRCRRDGHDHDADYAARCALRVAAERVRTLIVGASMEPRYLSGLWRAREREHRRADRRDGCRRYTKAIAVLEPVGWDEMLEADLATVDFDLIVVERGYRRD